MTGNARNVVVLKPRRKRAPALRFVELRLIDETCDLEMTLHDDAGNIVAVLAYSLSSVARQDFDLNLLRDFWDRHRGGTAAAS